MLSPVFCPTLPSSFPSSLRIFCCTLSLLHFLLRPPPLLSQTGAALIFDAVELFATALTTLEKSSDVAIERLYCDMDGAWKHGTSLINFMRMVSLHVCMWVRCMVSRPGSFPRRVTPVPGVLKIRILMEMGRPHY